MRLGEVTYEILADWWNKGIRFWRLSGKSLQRQRSCKRAIAVLVTAVVVTSFLEVVALKLTAPKTPVDISLGVLLFGFWHLLSLALFLVILFLWLWIARASPQLNTVAALTFYTFSGAFPLLMLCLVMSEQLSEAIRLFLLFRDPGLPYVTGATINLLFPERATVFAHVQIWIFFLFEVVVFVAYFLWNLPRVLIDCCAAVWRGINVILACLASLAAHHFLVHYFLMQRYWQTVGAIVRE